VHTFTNLLAFKTAGKEAVAALDSVNSTIHGLDFAVVSAAAASTLTITAPSTATKGTAFTTTVTAFDPFGNVATGYRGTIHFSSTDLAASLPVDYKFTSTDSGIHTFTNGVTFNTDGTQTITATDKVTSTITGTASVIVSGPVKPITGVPTLDQPALLGNDLALQTLDLFFMQDNLTQTGVFVGGR
jgi:hypothetical protein